MASGARSTRRGMFRVIESGVETAQRWKGFDLTTLRVCMTDRTNLIRRTTRELLLMTTCARRMRRFAGQGWLR